MGSVVVVGSGASGVHFALSVLRRGWDVTMVDVGRRAPEGAETGEAFADLRTKLEDPVRFFLGERYESVNLPGATEYYGFPPSKGYVFAPPPGFEARSTEFAPLFSFAQGGLAQAWTGGAYPLDDQDLHLFPFGYAELGPHYGEVAGRIGISGVADDLADVFPVHDNLMEPLRLDAHGAALVAAYQKRRTYFRTRLRCRLGRSRVAVLSADRDGRRACDYLGRCLWGCPRGALYTPSATLAECRGYPNFTYLAGLEVSHLRTAPGGRVISAVVAAVDGGAVREVTADRFVLAAGALSSSKIFLRTIREATGETVRLSGLMDNRQILVPFLNLGLVGKAYEPDSYQYHQIVINIEGERPGESVHGQITTLKGALVHPILQVMPLDLSFGSFLLRNIRAGLGVVNVNLHDTRRPENQLTLDPSDPARLVISYTPDAEEPARVARAVATIKRALRNLGCLVPPGMVNVRPMGASVHYSGTVPMSRTAAPRTVSPECRSHDFENLWLVDGATFPFLPAKNITFTLMANAARVAAVAF